MTMPAPGAAWSPTSVGPSRRVASACRILMDLAGQKLRTGPVGPGARVVKWRPRRDPYGRVIAPARIWLMPADHAEPPPSKADASLPVPGRWLAELNAGDRVAFTDTRGASRTLDIVAAVGDCRWAEAIQTAYVAPGVRLRLDHSRAAKTIVAEVSQSGRGR